MNTQTLSEYLRHVGRGYNDLVLSKLAESGKLLEIFPGSLTKHYEPEPGICLDFWAETLTFEKLHVCVAKTTPSSEIYRGVLEEPFGNCLDRASVLEKFGSPMESKEPFQMPLSLGDIGGWDSFDLSALGHPDLEVTYTYDAGLLVTGLVFSLKVTSFDKMLSEENAKLVDGQG